MYVSTRTRTSTCLRTLLVIIYILCCGVRTSPFSDDTALTPQRHGSCLRGTARGRGVFGEEHPSTTCARARYPTTRKARTCVIIPISPHTLFSNVRRALGLGLELATVIATHIVNAVRVACLLLLRVIIMLFYYQPSKGNQLPA